MTAPPVRDATHLLVFRLDGQRYALPLAAVERVVRAVALTPLPHAPAVVLGVVDVAGEVVPVLSLRRRFALPDRDITPADQFVIARTASRRVALVVDETQDVGVYGASAIVDAGVIVPGLEYIHGVVTLEDGLVVIQDLEQCLSLEEEQELTTAMGHAAPDA